MTVLLEYINQCMHYLNCNGPVNSGRAVATPAPPSEPPLAL